MTPSTVVRDLGIFLDSDISMRFQVSQTVSHCFRILRQLCTIHPALSVADSQSVFQSLVAALAVTKLNFGNAMLAGITSFELDHLQVVMNAADKSL